MFRTKDAFCLTLSFVLLWASPLVSLADENDESTGAVTTGTVAEGPAVEYDSGWLSEYERLGEWQFSSTGTPLPEGGLTLQCEHATWKLSSGSLSAMRPTADGRVTGYYFSGQGTFEMYISDPIEVKQLARFSDKPETETLQDSFSEMIIRTTRDLSELLGVQPAEPYGQIDVVKGRHNDWQRSGMYDLDARVVAGLLTAGDDFLMAEMNTASFGWLAFRLDPWSLEPVSLVKLHEPQDTSEIWVSLPRFDESPGQPGYERIDLRHIEAEIDLTDHDGREYRPGYSTHGDKAHFVITEYYTPQVGGAQTLQLTLRPTAEVKRVSDGEGRELPFIRAHFGKMYASIENDIYDFSLVVIFPEPLVAGREYSLTVAYDIEIYNYVGGMSWYPTLREAFNDNHTAKLVFKHKDKFGVRAVGNETSSTTSDGITTSTWEMTRPTKMIGFSFGNGYEEEKLQIEEGPEVVVFGRETAATSGNLLRNVAIDVAKSLHFYEWYFGTPLPTKRIYATRIGSGHGQAFDGFIHLSHYTFNYESTGGAELFRSHEAAHQYWGHLVGWKSYRDQWLSEGLAEYSSMLYLQATMPKEKYFEEVLDVYFAEQLGHRGADMSRFARPGFQLEYQDVRDQIGPIGVGYRASTARVPYGYFVQAYNKGALVIHMLRMMLYGAFNSDEGFRSFLQDFLKTYQGDVASTDDMAALLSKRFGGEWGWFFDQWVYGTDIPTYEWSYSVPKKAVDGSYPITITVRQSGVSEGFMMPVPIEVDFGGGKTGRIPILVSKPEETFTIPVPKPPKKVTFNPDHAVLAEVKKL